MRTLAAFLAFAPTIAFAQTADVAAGPSGGLQQLAGVAPLIAIGAVMYFLLIRPQMKRMKDQQAMIGALKKGDEVVTAGGIVGKITKVGEGDTVTVEIAKTVEVTVLKATITSTLGKGKEAAKAAAPASKKKTAEKNDNAVPSKDKIANDN